MFRIYENNNWKEDHQDYHQSEEQNQEDHHNHLQLTLAPRGLKITNFKKIKYVHNSIIQKGQIGSIYLQQGIYVKTKFGTFLLGL
jgi:hypothetical protein